jgi:hypothetical protein
MLVMLFAQVFDTNRFYVKLQHLHDLLDTYCGDRDREGIAKTLEIIAKSYKRSVLL